MVHCERIPVPVLAGDYRRIYNPQPDQYKGIDTANFQNGAFYEDWIVNDFTFIRDQADCWHVFGITHPRPDGFTDAFNFDMESVHEAENQLFHVRSDCKSLEELLADGRLHEQEKILYPQQRPGESPECWAPCIVQKGDLYYLFYSPKHMRLATSADLSRWECRGSVFSGTDHMRDPYIYYEDGRYTMIYVSDNLEYRTSDDLLHWSESVIFQHHTYGPSSQESPCVFRRGDYYYLLWCLYDGRNGCYDHRTFVFASKSLEGPWDTAPITMLPGHGTEILMEGGNTYAVSVYYPDNGLNMAKIEWI